MSVARVLLSVAIVVAFTLTLARWPAGAAAPRPFERAAVHLYSNGQVVGEWEAVGPGRVDGDTFVFPVRMGIEDREVRIRGTFSLEPIP